MKTTTKQKPKDFCAILQENVLARRTELGMTQKGLAELTGIRQPYVAKIEAGEQIPSLEILGKLATALNTSVEALLADGSFSKILS